VMVPGLTYGYLGAQLGVYVSVQTAITANCTNSGGGIGCSGALTWSAPGERNFTVTAAALATPGSALTVTVSSIAYTVSLNVTAGGTLPFLGRVLVPILPLLPLGSFLGTPSAVSDSYVVTPPPTIPSFSASVDPMIVNQSSTLTANATGGSGPLAFKYGGLPAGCASSNTSSLDCTPASTGTYSVAVTVTDPQHETSSKNLTVHVVLPPSPPSRTTSLPAAPFGGWIVLGVAGVVAVAFLALALILRRRPARP
jgi:hypothetical protein